MLDLRWGLVPEPLTNRSGLDAKVFRTICIRCISCKGNFFSPASAKPKGLCVALLLYWHFALWLQVSCHRGLGRVTRRWPSQPLAPPRGARQNFLFRYKHFAFLFFYLFFFSGLSRAGLWRARLGLGWPRSEHVPSGCRCGGWTHGVAVALAARSDVGLVVLLRQLRASQLAGYDKEPRFGLPPCPRKGLRAKRSRSLQLGPPELVVG